MSDLEHHELLLRAQREQAKRDIIDSSLEDVPPPGGKAQLLAALNLTGSDGKTAPEAPRSRPFGGSAAYVVGLALVVGAGTAFLASSTAEGPYVGPAPSTSEAAAPQVAPPIDEAGPPQALVAPPEVVAPSEKAAASSSPASLPVAESAPDPSSNARSPRSVPLTTKARSESTLGREVARMTAARSALSAGDTARTLELLDSYESEFPQGAFSVEVSVLRVESLARSGRMDEARRVGERFLQEQPHGLPASRVAATLGIPGAPGPESTPDL